MARHVYSTVSKATWPLATSECSVQIKWPLFNTKKMTKKLSDNKKGNLIHYQDVLSPSKFDFFFFGEF